MIYRRFIYRRFTYRRSIYRQARQRRGVAGLASGWARLKFSARVPISIVLRVFAFIRSSVC